MVEIWEVYRNKIFLKNFFKFVNFMVGNNVEYKNDNKIDMQCNNYILFFSSDYGKEKFMYFNYEIKNVLRIV